MLWSSIEDGDYIAVQEQSSNDRLHQKKRKADELDATGSSSKRPTAFSNPKRIEVSTKDDITFLRTDFPEPIKPVSKCHVSQSIIDKQGMGLRASVNIKSGDIIITENPFIVVDFPPLESQVGQVYQDLSGVERLLFHSFNGKPTRGHLSNRKIPEIITNNVIPLGVSEEDDEPTQSGMFQHICRINHSCVPNARWTWMDETSSMELKAIFFIRADEEITACYLDDHTELYADRQAFLKDNWGFTCSCSACPTSDAKQIASDERLKRYRVIRDRYIGNDNSENWAILGFQECWIKIKEGLRLIEREERYREVADCWESLFHLSVGWGEHAKALEAGKEWMSELARTGDMLKGAEFECTKNPETVDGWCKFLEIAEIEFAPEPDSDGEDDFESHWTSSKRRRVSRKQAIHTPRGRSQSSVSSSYSSSSSSSSTSSSSSPC